MISNDSCWGFGIICSSRFTQRTILCMCGLYISEGRCDDEFLRYTPYISDSGVI